MGLFDAIFKNRPKPVGKYEGDYRMLTGYAPRFTRWNGDLYAQELIRAIINAKATQISKLHVEIFGSARPALRSKMQHGPNQFQTWEQFLARLSTIYDIHNTAFIVPVYDELGQPSGVYTPLPNRCEVIQYDGVPYLRYEFAWGERAAVEMTYCGIMVKHQYRSDFFGETNEALKPTMELIHIQNQGIEEGVKSAATYRFMAQLKNFAKTEDLAAERKRFTEANFSKDSEGGGMLLFPNIYDNIKQIESKPWVIDADQMQAIKENAFEYYGVNEDILQNKAFGDAWAAFYEGVIEPFAIQFSSVMTKMLYTLREQSSGNYVMATANRLQYMSNSDKLQVSAQMADRGLMTRNEIREIWNLPPLPEPMGSQMPVRGEYYTVGEENSDDGSDENDQPET